jgi:hypothetical protein
LDFWEFGGHTRWAATRRYIVVGHTLPREGFLMAAIHIIGLSFLILILIVVARLSMGYTAGGRRK